MLKRLSFLILILSGGAAAQEADVDALMAGFAEDGPGGVVAVYRGGDIEFAKGYGLANVEHGVPNSPSTPYHVASVSKQFTAFAVALLADQGRLSLDDDVRRYIPELADFGHPITLRHLATHTSGLRDHWTLWAMAGGRMDDVIRQGDLMRLVQRQRDLNFVPGTEHLYSNTGYLLLAEVVARVTGEPFGVWMEAHVFAPLGMDDTQVVDDHERIVPGRAASYYSADGELKRAVLSYANAGATGLVMTAEDLAHWLRNLATHEVGGPAVAEAMLERGVLASGDTLGYALGVVADEHRGLRRIRHGGSDAGFRTSLVYYPEIDAGIVAMGNVASFDAGRTATAVAEVFFSEHMTPASAAQAPLTDRVRVPLARLDAYAGAYRIEDGPAVTITRTGDGLAMEVEGWPPAPLAALADTLFRVAVPGVDVRVGLSVAPDGRVERGTFYQGERSTPLRRLGESAWDPSPEALAALAGRYVSPELDAAYEARVDGDRLVLVHRRHGEIALSPTAEDAFSSGVWFLRTVTFERDVAGRPTAMLASSDRVRDLRFERRE
ncbi:serine hydrolase [Rubrivirga sp.]|uniref:serine hydrolase n=1 Tax=Rubrivirga sp. TaxID=1885344 RepID=UPI003C76AEF8